MSDVFDLDTAGQQQLTALAKSNPVPIDQMGSGFWEGVPKAIGMGLMWGGASAARAVGIVDTGLRAALLSPLGDESGQITDPYFQMVDRYAGEAINAWTPDANSVGTAGRILGGLAKMVLPLMAGAGNPTLMIGSSGINTAVDLSQQGASNVGAVAAGTIEAAANAIGFKIPFLGSSLATRILSGAVGNVAVGAGGAAAEKEALQLTGNQDLAANIHPLDAEARLIDLLSGAAFGGIAHLGMRDAVKTAANAKHFQHDTAPGTPVDIEASVAHQAAIDEGIRAIMEDRLVSLASTGVQDANFLHDRKLPEMDGMPEELKGVDEAIKEQPAQNPERVDLEQTDTIRLFRGEGPDQIQSGEWWTTNQAKAEKFAGTDGKLLTLEVSPQELGMKFAQGHGGADEYVFGGKLENISSRISEHASPDASSVNAQAKESVHPIVAAAQQALDKADIQIPTGDLHEDGTTITTSGRELMAKLGQDVQTARNEAKAFDALANCILFRGS